MWKACALWVLFQMDLKGFVCVFHVGTQDRPNRRKSAHTHTHKELLRYLCTCRGPVVVAATAEGRVWCFITSGVIYRLTGEFHYQRAKNSSSVITGLDWICEPAALLCLRIKWEILDAWQDWLKNQQYFNAKWWIILKTSWSVCAHVLVWEGIRASWCTVSSVGMDWWMRRYDVDQQDMTNELFHQPFPISDCMMEATGFSPAWSYQSF